MNPHHHPGGHGLEVFVGTLGTYDVLLHQAITSHPAWDPRASRTGKYGLTRAAAEARRIRHEVFVQAWADAAQHMPPEEAEATVAEYARVARQYKPHALEQYRRLTANGTVEVTEGMMGTVSDTFLWIVAYANALRLTLPEVLDGLKCLAERS